MKIALGTKEKTSSHPPSLSPNVAFAKCRSLLCIGIRSRRFDMLSMSRWFAADGTQNWYHGEGTTTSGHEWDTGC